MAGNTIGQIFRLTSFGESHGPAIGGVIDGCPAGLEIDLGFISRELKKRKPGAGPASSPRKEDDHVEFLSGIFNGMSTGTPIAFLIRNKDHKPEDYNHSEKTYRPSHADFTYEKKYGIRDHRGGGRASARETAVRVVAGAIAKLLLGRFKINIIGYVSKIGPVTLNKEYSLLNLDSINNSSVKCPDPESSQRMLDLLEEKKRTGDTLGGVVTCIVTGVAAGLGEPVFDRLEADLGKAILSINAVKGFDIGSGIEASESTGSAHNDKFIVKNGTIGTLTNRSGGVVGGITNGEDIYFRAYFKPVSSIMQDQETIDQKGNRVLLKGKGRHDVCVVPRAVTIVEAMTAITLADFQLRNNNSRV